MTHRWAAVLALVAALGAGRAVAAAELVWNVPSPCANEVDVREQVERLIGAKLESVEGMDFEVEVTENAAGAWALQLSTKTASNLGVRELTARTCREVVDAGAVAIAMAVQSRIDDAVEEAPALEPEQRVAEQPVSAAPSPLTEPQRPAERDSPVELAPSATFDVALALGASLDTGALPSPAPGVELDVTLGAGAFRFVAFGSIYAGQSAELADGRGGTFELAAGGLLVCLWKELGGFEGSACGGAELGNLTGEGTGSVVEPKLGSHFWRAARLELGARLPLSSTFSLAGRGGLVAPLARPEFALDETDVVHRPAAYSFRGFVGLEVRL